MKLCLSDSSTHNHVILAVVCSTPADFQQRLSGQERGQRGEHTEKKLACDQWILRTSVKYDREPSKSTWQADRQTGFSTLLAMRKMSPTAAQTRLHLSFCLVKWHLLSLPIFQSLRIYITKRGSWVSSTKAEIKRCEQGAPGGFVYLRIILTDWIAWKRDVGQNICLV